MTTITIYSDAGNKSTPMKAINILKAEWRWIRFEDDKGVDREFVGMSYAINRWPSNQQEIFGEF